MLLGAKHLLNKALIRTFGFKNEMAKTIVDKNLEIHVLPAFRDNYMYLLVDNETKDAAAVDPFDSDKMLSKVQELGVNLDKVLTTHHHHDHAGGNAGIASKIKNIKIYGGDGRVSCLTNQVKHGDTFEIGQLKVKCLSTPCHTTGHICYYVTCEAKSVNPAVFTGDTLFFAGCGRFFEGTAQQMYDALCKVLGKLPDNTMVFCGHEYTVKNLKYALHVEPQNETIKSKLLWAQETCNKGEFTVPSTISLEKEINPFMRVHIPEVQAHAGHIGDQIATMDYLRKEKNNF